MKSKLFCFFCKFSVGEKIFYIFFENYFWVHVVTLECKNSVGRAGYNFTALLPLALRDLLFSCTSFSVGRIGFFVSTVICFLCLQLQGTLVFSQMQSRDSLLNSCFTILSSIEWKDITNIFPSFSSNSIACPKESSKFHNSLFTSILKA